MSYRISNISDCAINKHLWNDKEIFDSYNKIINKTNKKISENSIEVNHISDVAKILDDLFQYYEGEHGNMPDPIFYWWFAKLNSILYFEGNGDSFMRKQYALNGFITGLNKHTKTPSYSAEMISDALSIIARIDTGVDGSGWVTKNRSTFIPISDSGPTNHGQTIQSQNNPWWKLW